MKLAILETDTPIDKIRERYNGTYGTVFKHLFEQCGIDREKVEFEHYDVVNELDRYPDLNSTDSILITGSKHCCFGEDEWIKKLVDYTRSAIEDYPDLKVIGICFGHQIVGRALGANAGQNPKGWEVASTEITLTDTGKKLLGDIHNNDKITISQMHRDILFDVPKGTELLAYNDVCQVQGLYRPNKLVTFQGHPEYDGRTVRDIVETRESSGVFSNDQAESYRERSRQPEDGPAIATRMLKDLGILSQ